MQRIATQAVLLTIVFSIVSTGVAQQTEDGAKAGVKASPTKPVSELPLIQPRQSDGDGSISIDGERKVWHTTTLTLNGPYAHERDNEPNPFTDYRFECVFRHLESGAEVRVPGYFAADGNAGETSAESGTKWRLHFVPDRAGQWQFKYRLQKKKLIAISGEVLDDLEPLHKTTGSFEVLPTDKTETDFRHHGRLQYVGKPYLQHAGSKKFFIKAGADAPETLLGYADFDGTVAKKKGVPLKHYRAHVADWHDGDPSWPSADQPDAEGEPRGKGLIGAINYLSGKGCNAFSFLTYNAGGDGDNVWPFIQRDDKLHYDCSKLDQWGIVFDHGTSKGMYLHFKLQETENDDHFRGHKDKKGGSGVPESLDGGDLGLQRKLYLRELIARFGHNLALNWNLGEENTQSTAQQIAMIDYIHKTDPYSNNIVIHTYPGQQDKIYGALLGDRSHLTGTSLQNSDIKDTHQHTVKWVRRSAESGKPWIVAFDESGSAAHGQCPDLGYRGFDGHDADGKMIYTQHEVRRQTLWGHLMGGGAGVEYYFGYKFAENDLKCEDWRSRDQSWDYCRIAIEFFQQNEIPFEQMKPNDELVGNTKFDNSRYCLALPGEIYLVYLPFAGKAELNLVDAEGTYAVQRFNPRDGGELEDLDPVTGGASIVLDSKKDDKEDWLLIVRKQQQQ